MRWKPIINFFFLFWVQKLILAIVCLNLLVIWPISLSPPPVNVCSLLHLGKFKKVPSSSRKAFAPPLGRIKINGSLWIWQSPHHIYSNKLKLEKKFVKSWNLQRGWKMGCLSIKIWQKLQVSFVFLENVEILVRNFIFCVLLG